jgi:hypothetical protein
MVLMAVGTCNIPGLSFEPDCYLFAAVQTIAVGISVILNAVFSSQSVRSSVFFTDEWPV